MTSLHPDALPKLNHRTPSPAINGRPTYVSIHGGGHDLDTPLASGATTPHGHPLPSYNRMGPPNRRQTAVPYLKLLPLCIARIAEGMIGSVIFPYINEMILSFGVNENERISSVIFPYINEMILSFGVNENDVGVWSAVAESTLMVTEAIVAPLYAPIGDKFGRRPVILTLVVFWGVFAIGFGLVKSLMMAILFRGCLGLLAGVGVLTRTMVGELCDKTNRVEGFAVFTPALTVGFTLGPLIGGLLANPVPRLLSPSFTTFALYPYLLPAIVTGIVALLGSATGYFLLPETRPPKLRREQDNTGDEKQAPNGMVTLFHYKPFREMVILYGINNGVQFAWEAFFPLFAFTSTDLGGLGLGTDAIGIVMACSAGLSILMTVFVFPFLHRRLPENLFLRICLLAYPAAVLFFPFAWYFNYTSSTSLPLSVVVILSVQMVLRRMGDFAATLLDTVVLDMIPNPEYLALANSLTFSIAAIGRAIGPFIISYLFSLSTHASSPFSFGRHIVWVLFIALCMPSVWLAGKMGSDDRGNKNEGHGEETHELLGQRGRDDL